jgi:hypothetical protein
MRGEESKRAVQEIEKNAHYATTGSACRRALNEDTADGYTRALKEIVNSPNRSGEYGVNIDKAERALREDR